MKDTVSPITPITPITGKIRQAPRRAAFFDVSGTLVRQALWNESGLAAYLRHAVAGDLMVLVSSSPLPVVAPLAARLGADEMLTCMRGHGKGYAARTLMREYGFDPADCHAYADEAADLALLTEVGNPVVVGDDPVLLSHARRGTWPVLSE
ncbi:HAD family hydrolase [Streptomyces sp. NPDC019443]|uniref:HAD family hydrolase n=1 Tax=Streptomyces sp. NPDC019443 TaxID=3365061 RepID=UPI0037974CCC